MIEIAAAVIVEGDPGDPDQFRVLVARRRPTAPRGGLWEFPGGKIERGESAATAAVRESREEIGCEVEIIAPLTVSEDRDERERKEQVVRVHALLARGRGVIEPRPLASEEVRWASIGELERLPVPRANQAILAALVAWSESQRRRTTP